MPEPNLRTRFGDEPAYDAVRHDRSLYPIERIAQMADLANARRSENVEEVVKGLRDEDPAVRYWAAIGCGATKHAGTTVANSLIDRVRDEKAGCGWLLPPHWLVSGDSSPLCPR